MAKDRKMRVRNVQKYWMVSLKGRIYSESLGMYGNVILNNGNLCWAHHKERECCENVGTLAFQASDASASPRKFYCRAQFILNIGRWWCTFIWDPYREGHIRALDRVQKRAARFAHNANKPNWETLTSRRKLLRICALFKAYSGDRAWKPIGDRLKRPHYLSRIDHVWKIRCMKQRTDIGKFSFANRTIQLWNQLPAVVLGNLPCKQNTFKKRVRKAIIECN